MRYTPLLLALLLAGCGSTTHIVQSWRDPEVSIEQGSVKKMLIIALVRDEATRRLAEDEMSTQFKGRGVSSYMYLGPLPTQIDPEAFAQRLKGDGIDAVMMMRLVAVDQQQTYVPGTYPTYYANPYGYYGYAYPMYANAGYVQTDMLYKVESNFYSVEKGKLVWSGISSSMNPTDITTTVDEIAIAIREKMEHEGFLTKPPAP